MPDPTIGDLMRQGLTITVLGVSLVFASLGLLWGLMELLMRLLPMEKEAGAAGLQATRVAEPVPDAAASAAAALTAERARVAAIVAAAVQASALQAGSWAPAETAQEAGEPASTWVSTKRADVLRPWQPPRSRVS